MKLSKRDQRALWILGVSVALILMLHFGLRQWEAGETAPASDSIAMSEKRLQKLRQMVASLPAKEQVARAVAEELAQRESGMIQAETAAQAQAQLQQVFRRVAAAQAPPIEIKTTEMGQVRALGDDYGEVFVPVTFECRIEQWLNLLADLTAQPEALAASELRISGANAREKTMMVRLTLSGVVPKRLVPERKGPF